mmetsp:Transcript_32213/g.68101  ORF Transcript_32213/g.68101 Transcript_32213/m.68101 type:complete len:376 (+) Transcript_32213:40-1167(+)
MGSCVAKQNRVVSIHQPEPRESDPPAADEPVKPLEVVPAEPVAAEVPGVAPQSPKQKKNLIRAIKDVDVTAVKELIADGCELDARGMWENTPLIVACSHGQGEIASALLSAKADATLVNELGATALHYACIEGLNDDVVTRLCEAGAQVNAKPAKLYNRHLDNYVTCTPLVASAMGGFTHVCSILMQHKAEVDSAASEGSQTALWMACRYERGPAVKLLLKEKADPRVKSTDGVSCLGALSLGESFDGDILMDLLNCNPPQGGGAIDVNDTVGAPVVHAARKDNQRVMEILVTQGADVTRTAGPRKSTALHVACEKKNGRMIQLLLQHKADPEAKDMTKQTPRDILASRAAGEDLMRLFTAKEHQPEGETGGAGA